MNIRKLFGEVLVDTELYSNEDAGGGMDLDITDPNFGVASYANRNPRWSEEFSHDIKTIYSQVRQIDINWNVDSRQNDKVLLADPFLKEKYFDQDYDLSTVKEYLSGNIGIVSFHEMIGDKEHLSYLKGEGVSYLPLDKHWGLTACVKSEMGVVENNVYLFDAEDAKLHDMGVGVIEYLNLAYQAKGFYHWQYAYLFFESLHNERLLTMLPKILSEVELDLSAFQK